MTEKIKVATRGSLLALTQTGWVVQRLKEAAPSYDFEIVTFKTVGDKVLDVALSKIGGKGLFTKELEDALLQGEADLAVHSLKDMPTELPPGLMLGAIPRREDSRDALITPLAGSLAELPPGTVIGTSSLRRVAQLRKLRPDLEFTPIRGNIDTRLRKLTEGQVGAIIMAAAGLHRAGFADRITEYLEPADCVPAAGQGALAIEIREGDRRVAELVNRIHDPSTHLRVCAERAFLGRLQGGCQVPIAAHATLADGQLHLTGLVASVDGQETLREAAAIPAAAGPAEAEALGVALAERLLDRGAAALVLEAKG